MVFESAIHKFSITVKIQRNIMILFERNIVINTKVVLTVFSL